MREESGDSRKIPQSQRIVVSRVGIAESNCMSPIDVRVYKYEAAKAYEQVIQIYTLEVIISRVKLL
jgi:hypothetical protein